MLRLFHKDLEAYLAAEGLWGLKAEKTTEDGNIICQSAIDVICCINL